jgi:hypothetical protein
VSGRRPSSAGAAAGAAVRGPDALAGILLTCLEDLAATGNVEVACRLAGRACVALRESDPAAERRFNGLLHRLTRRLEW